MLNGNYILYKEFICRSYTLKELNNKQADIINALILEGYKIIPTEQTNNKKNLWLYLLRVIIQLKL